MASLSSNRPRLLCLSPFASERRGTLLYRTLPMLRRLQRLGWQVTLLLPGWDLAPGNVNAMKWKLGKIDYHILPPLHRSGIQWQLHYAWEMVQWAQRTRPDAVLAAKAVGAPALAISLLRRWRKVGRWSGQLWLDSDDWEGKGGWADKLPKVQSILVATLESSALRAADRVSVASHYLQKRLLKMGRSPENVCYLPNGMETLPKRCIPSELPTSVLFYSRLAGVEPLHAATVLTTWLQHNPDLTAIWLGAPVSSEKERKFIEAFNANQRLLTMAPPPSSRLLRVGWLGAVRWPIMAQVDFAVYLANDDIINRSKFPVRLLEMMAIGIPIFAEKVGEVPFMIEHNKSGYLMQSSSTELTKEIDRIMRHGAYTSWGREARRTVQKRYWWPTLSCPFWLTR